MPVVEVKINNVTLPSSITALKRNDELLWSEGTGRAANSGLMVGSVVSKKMTYNITWGVLNQSEYNAIRNAFTDDFFNLKITLNGEVVCNASFYRGTITADVLQSLGNTNYWKGVAVDLVQR